MKEFISKLINAIIGIFKVGQAVEQADNKQQELLDRVRQAHKDWQTALNNFNYCSDPDMIDYAIYNIDATEKKYIGLIKIARKENVTAQLQFDESDK